MNVHFARKSTTEEASVMVGTVADTDMLFVKPQAKDARIDIDERKHVRVFGVLFHVSFPERFCFLLANVYVVEFLLKSNASKENTLTPAID